jgi:hypothetical protein
MQHTNRPLLALALAAVLGAAPALAPRDAAAQGKGHKNGHVKAKSKGAKRFASFDETRRDDGVLRDRGYRHDDDDLDDRDDAVRQPGKRGRGVGSRGVPPGHMPPAGMCRIWIDGVPPGRQPAPTDCATAERTRPSNARVVYGAQSNGSVSRWPAGSRTVVRRDASCADVNGDGRRERVAYIVNGRVVRTECR